MKVCRKPTKPTKLTWPISKNKGVKTGCHVYTKFMLFSLTVLFSSALANTIDYMYFQGHTHGEVMSAVPAIISLIFHFEVVWSERSVCASATKWSLYQALFLSFSLTLRAFCWPVPSKPDLQFLKNWPQVEIWRSQNARKSMWTIHTDAHENTIAAYRGSALPIK